MMAKSIAVHSSTVVGFVLVSMAIMFGLTAEELSVFNSFVLVPLLIVLNAAVFSLVDEKMVKRFVA